MERPVARRTAPQAAAALAGDNAIVDWILIELRSSTAPSTIAASRSGLLQRDGDVVDLDGSSSLSFPIAAGDYHVAIRHRDHLAAMTASPLSFGTGPVALDMRSPGTATFGDVARKSIGGTFPTLALWSGDVNFDGVLKYTGVGNDRDPILLDILTEIGDVVPTATITGYRASDVNLDGVVKYTGFDNDRDPILQHIGGVVPTNILEEQLP